jgi:putative transposase
MPRQARLVAPQVALHIVQRGHNRGPCFAHDTDYLVYLATLAELLPQSSCALHAYCLMTNHVHLLLTPSAPESCGRLMRNLGQRYVQYFNRRHNRSGTLWEGRFRSCLVDSARYVLACYRYIERNPVRAGMVASAAAYPWSSYHGNMGAVQNKLLTPHAELFALSDDDDLRRKAYLQLFDEADDPGFLAAVRDATNGGFALVDDLLKPQLAAQSGRHVERRKSGPAPAGDGRTLDLLSEELGLRPGRS